MIATFLAIHKKTIIAFQCLVTGSGIRRTANTEQLVYLSDYDNNTCARKLG